MPEEIQNQTPPARSKDEVALELMKFVATTTGYGRAGAGAGFAAGKTKSPEEQAEALLQLFEKCRDVVGK
jgi:hypothetical protein